METKGFTIIEIVVAVGITIVLMLAVGNVMTSAFKAKSGGEQISSVSAQSQIVMTKLKENIFDADINSISCPVGVGESISFNTKTGGKTTLVCNPLSARIASISAQSGTFWLTNNDVAIQNCGSFVSCMSDGQKITSVDFNLVVGVTSATGIGETWSFVSKVVPRW